MKAKLVGKLKKLIRHERSARRIGSFAEADAYLEAIDRFRSRHKIFEEIPLDEDAGFETDDFDAEFVFAPESRLYRRTRIVWEEVLLQSIATFFGCRMAIKPDSNLKLIIGAKPARARVRNSFLFLHAEALGMSKKYLRQFPEISSKEKRELKESFLHGFTAGMMNRLSTFCAARQRIEEMKDFLGDAPENSQALVKSTRIIISDRRTRLNTRMADAKPPPDLKIDPDKIDGNAFSAGAEFGQLCSLSEDLALPAETLEKQWFDIQEKIRRKQEEDYVQRVYDSIRYEPTYQQQQPVQIKLNFWETD